MTKRKILILTFILVTISSACLTILYFNKNIYPLWNVNQFNISAEEPLNKEKIKIYFGVSVNTINRDNDSDLFYNMQKYTLLCNEGIKINDMDNEYGENDFLITYNNEYYFSFRQFKTNRGEQHTYNINLKEQNDIPLLKVEIEGQASMKFTRSMIGIKDTNKYRCNVPKEKAGIIYNMIELVGQ